MAGDDDLLLSLAVEACEEPAARPVEGTNGVSVALEDTDLFLELASAAEADEDSSGGVGSGSSGKASSGPRLSWAARAAASGTAGAVPPGHQPRKAVLLPPGAIPRSAPPPQVVLPGEQEAAPSAGVAIFGARQPATAGGAQRSRGTAAPSTFADVGQGTLVERHAGLKIKNPRVSHTQLRSRLTDTAVLRLSQVKQRHRTAGLEGSWATICVVGEKSKPRETATGRTYSIWKVTDLDQTCLSLFLFSGAHDDLWREAEGTIVALFTPKVRAEGDFLLSVDSADQVWVLGQNPEFGYCKAKKKNGEPCRMPVNVARCPFCPYHVQSEYNRMKPSGRNEFQGSNLKTAFRPGMQRGLQWAPGEFDRQANREPRIKQMGADQLEGLAANARERGSAAGARYLNTVANPAAAAAAEAATQRRLTPAAAIAEAAQRGPMAAALAAAPIPAARSGGSLVLQLPSQAKQKRKAAVALGGRPREAGAGAKRRSSAGGGTSAGPMIELEDDDDELAPAGGSGTAAAFDPTADARARAVALLRAAGAAGASQRQQQAGVAPPARVAQPAAAGAGSRVALSPLQAGAGGIPPIPSVVSGGPSGPRVPPPVKRAAPAARPGGSTAAAATATARKPTAVGAAGKTAAAAPKSAMEAAFGGVLEEVAASGAAQRGTRYKELVDDEEHEQLDKVMTALEQKDEAAAKMDSITRLSVQAFRCKVCKYTAERRRPECAAHAYAVERVEATKRWWQCNGCKYRFTTVGQKYPSSRCIKCNQPGTHFTAVSMLRHKKEHDFEKQQSTVASRDKLLARGNEQKWCNSW